MKKKVSYYKMITFIHDSDLHYGRHKLAPRQCKETHPEHISLEEADFVIVTGDLTDNGHDGSYCMCFSYGGNQNQRRALMEQYVKPIESSGKDVYLCAGNHDRGKTVGGLYIYPAIKYLIQKRHGGYKYTFRRDGLYFICCGECPRDAQWLRKQLKDITEPTIIFFHFNIEGPHSNRWTRKEKKAFYAAVKDYNIVAILVGHRHMSNVEEWKGLTVISAGDKYAHIIYDPSTQKLVDVQFRH